MKFNRSTIPQYLVQVILIFYILDIEKSAPTVMDKIANSLIMLLGLFWIFSGDFKNRLIKTIKNPIFVPIITFFILNLVGLLWSNNLNAGFYNVEKRLTLLIFPFIIGGLHFERKNLDRIYLTFIAICLVVTIIGLGYSFLRYLEFNDPAYFYSDHLFDAFGYQGVYFGIYSNLSLLFLAYFALGKPSISIRRRIIIPTFLFFVVVTFLSAGRTSILALIICVLLYIAFLIVRKKQYKLGVGISVTLLLLIVVGIFLFPNTVQRFKSVTSFEFEYDNPNPVNQFRGELKKENWNGLTLRLALWSCGFDIIKQHQMIGVGTGDYKDELQKVFKIKKFHYAAERNYDVHNQYLEAIIMWGWIGFLFFLFGLFYPAYLALNHGNYLYVLFVVIFLLAFLTESVLDRYIGIVLFGLLNSLLGFHSRTR